MTDLNCRPKDYEKKYLKNIVIIQVLTKEILSVQVIVQLAIVFF